MTAEIRKDVVQSSYDLKSRCASSVEYFVFGKETMAQVLHAAERTLPVVQEEEKKEQGPPELVFYKGHWFESQAWVDQIAEMEENFNADATDIVLASSVKTGRVSIEEL